MESQARVFWLLPLLYRTIPRLTLVTIDLSPAPECLCVCAFMHACILCVCARACTHDLLISWVALLIADCRPRSSILQAITCVLLQDSLAWPGIAVPGRSNARGHPSLEPPSNSKWLELQRIHEESGQGGVRGQKNH